MQTNQVNKVIIVGAGGFGKEVAALLDRLEGYSLEGFVDDNVSTTKSEVLGYPVLGTSSYLQTIDSRMAVAIAVAKPTVKRRLVNEIKANKNLYFPNLVDASAIVGLNVEFGEGNILMPNTVLTAEITIGSFNLINIASVIGHDCTVGSYNALYPTVNISGNVIIGDENEFGVGTATIQNIGIGSNNVFGAGSVVIRSVESGNTMVGIPARRVDK